MTDQPNWTDLTSDQKRDLIAPHITAGKLTYTQIAQLFGTTRNAISSAVARHKIVNPLTEHSQGLSPMKRAETARLLRHAIARTNIKRQNDKRKALSALRTAPKQPTPDHRNRPHEPEPFPENAMDHRPPKPDAWLPLGPPDKSILLTELTEHTCKWPIGADLPFLFCGQHTRENSPYCQTHHDAAYRPAPEIRLKRKKGTTNG